MAFRRRYYAGTWMVLGITFLVMMIPTTGATSVAPLPPGATIAWSHAPFEMGECGLCHVSDDPSNPGPVEAGGAELCYGCHEAIHFSERGVHRKLDQVRVEFYRRVEPELEEWQDEHLRSILREGMC